MKHLLNHSYLLWHLPTSEIGIRNKKAIKKGEKRKIIPALQEPMDN
jgi:hypothetical protein